MKKILLSAIFALFAVPAFASASTLNVISDATGASYYNALTKAADRLITLQNANGGWDWDVTGKTGPSAPYLNVTGVTAEALLNAYALTGKTTYLEAAQKAGDYIITTLDGATLKSINGYNLIFLKELSIATASSTYAEKAAEYFQVLYSATPTKLCATGCIDTAGVYAANVANRRWSTSTPNGIVAWDMAAIVEYASLAGDAPHAEELEAAIVSNLSVATSTMENYDLALASGLKAASLVGDTTNKDLYASLLSSADGSYGTVSDGKNQTTAYVLKAFKQVGDSRSAEAAGYLVSTFGLAAATSGWLDDGVEYAEVNSEAASALALLLPQEVRYYSLQSAVDSASDGDTIFLASDTTTASQITLSKAVTLDGNGHTLFAPFAFTSTSNNAAIGILHSGVTVKNLVVDGTGSTGSRHGINIFEATSSVNLEDVTVKNNAASGITINGSSVTVRNITTKNNTWGGINTDQATDAPDPTVLTITGVSSHTENNADIWVDNNLRDVTINDVNNQYASTTYPSSPTVTGRYYALTSVTADSEAQLRAALSDSLVSTITLTANITLAAELDINRPVDINGAGHVLGASFSGASVIQIMSNDVTLKNLIEDASGTTANRGINIYRVTGILLDNVTASNNSKNGIVVNGSTVTVNDITTKNNGWDGINVDKGSVISPASLTVNGVSSHAETRAAIHIDDTTIGAVTDTNNQYSFTETTANATTSRDYVLSGNISATNPQVSVISTVQPITVTVDTAAVNPQIDVHTLITAGSGTLPQITIDSSVAHVTISTSTLVTGPVGWDGIIQAPISVSASGNAPAGFSVGGNTISVGSPDGTLTFDRAVKITLPGATGTVGYKSAGSDNWQVITTQCTGADDHSNILSGECYFHDGGNTVIWTYHFTTFGSLSAIPAPAPVSGGGYFTVINTPASPAAVLATNLSASTSGQVLGTQVSSLSSKGKARGEVLGAAAYNFAQNLRYGMTGDDVTELQKMLIADGFLKIGKATKWFGPLTKSALVRWQAKNDLPATGFFGPMSRALVTK